MDEPIEAVTAEAVAELRQAGARFAYLHGSRAAGRSRAESDVDIAAYFGGRPPSAFDVLLPPGVDLLVLDDLCLQGLDAAVRGRPGRTGPLGGDDPEDLLRRASPDQPLPPGVRRRRHGQGPVAVVDEARVLRLLRSVSDDVSVLQRESGADEGRRADPIWLRGVKYTFVTAIEACLDVAQHICATEGWGPPADNGDAVRLLGEHGVCTPALARSIRQAVGFRNVLVHEYIRVNDDIVTDRLKALGDLEDFVSQVAGFVTRH